LRALGGAPGRPNTSHQPRVGFVAYLMTGDLFYLEEMQFWAAYSHNRDARNRGRCVVETQTRATAWSGIRLHTDIAWISPGDDPRLSYFDGILDIMFEVLEEQSIGRADELFPNIPIEGQSRLYGPGRATYVNARRMSPWQHSWVIWAIQMANRRGFERARRLSEWWLQFIRDIYTVENDDSQAWTGPDGREYRFGAQHAMAYDLAHTLFDEMRACDIPSGTEVRDVDTGPERAFVNWGELFYWTLVNQRHKDSPIPEWCPPDGRQWSPTNGINLYPVAGRGWHDYGGDPGAVAVAEAFMDNHEERRIPLPNAIEAYERQLELRLGDDGDEWERIIPVPLP